jgi:hypothetical protein
LAGFGVAGTAILSIAGDAGIGGGAIAGIEGVDGAGKPSPREFGAACLSTTAGSAGRLTEMTCVYALGSLAGAGWLGGVSPTRRLNAFVAPSEAEPACGIMAGLSITGVGNGGGGGTGRTGAVGTETTGVGATKESAAAEQKAPLAVSEKQAAHR